MSQQTFNRRKLAVALVLAVIALFQCIQLTTSARPLARVVTVDLTAEKTTLNSFADGLGSLEKNVADLSLRSSITSTEFNSVKTSASTLKTKVSPTQLAFQSIINKLKKAGEWENYDAAILSQITDPEGQTSINDAGGAKKILEAAAAQLGGLSMEIDTLIQPLNSKVASNGFSPGNRARLGFMPVRASFAPPAGVAIASVRCVASGALYVVVGSKKNYYRMHCNCSGDFCKQFYEALAQ